MTQLVTTRNGTVHRADCTRMGKQAAWVWDPRNDAPGVAVACKHCLDGRLPGAAPFCRVSVGLDLARGHTPAKKCGEPVVRHGLCAEHLAERIRLGGTP